MDIRTICLGVLTSGDATGYEIKKMFEEGPLSRFYEASYGSIYPALTRLTEEGLVECTELAQEKRPDKKIYSATPAGRMAFADEIVKAPSRDKFRSEFLVTLMFSDLLVPRQLARLIDDRTDYHLAQVRDLEEYMANPSADAGAGAQFAAGFMLSLHVAAAEYLTDNRYLVEGEALLPKRQASGG